MNESWFLNVADFVESGEAIASAKEAIGPRNDFNCLDILAILLDKIDSRL